MKKRLLAFIMAAGLLIGASPVYTLSAQAAQTSESAVSTSDDMHAEAKEFADTGTKSSRIGSSSSVKDSYWDQFSGHVYYDQLTGNEKTLYDKLKALAEKYMTGTTAASKKTLDDGSSGYYTQTVTYSSMTVDEAFAVATIFCFENPQYYFLNDGIAYTPAFDSYLFDIHEDGTLALGVYSRYAQGAARQKYTSQYRSAIEDYLNGASGYSSDLAKETYFHDRLASEVTYNNDTTDSNEDSTESQSASSAFFFKNTVCAGYSKAFSLLLNASGITNVAVTSDSHAWNEVEINGSWYITDVTWDVAQPASHTFFNVSDTQMQRADQMWSHYPLSFYSSIRPVCSRSHSTDVDAIDLSAASSTTTPATPTTDTRTDTDTQTTPKSDTDTQTTPKTDTKTTTEVTPSPKPIKVTKPVTPSTFSLKRVKRGTIRVTLKTKKKVSGFYVRYRVKGTKIWDVKWVSVNGKSKTFNLTGLRKGKTYQIKAYSTDKNGVLSKATKTKTIKA